MIFNMILADFDHWLLLFLWLYNYRTLAVPWFCTTGNCLSVHREQKHLALKPLYTFGTEKQKKVHRFTTHLQGLQQVMVKDFSWNIIPWNALMFEKTLKQLSILVSENYGFTVNTCHDTAKRAETGWVFPLFSPDSDERLSLNFHRFVILYRSCDYEVWALDNTVYRKCPLALNLIPKSCH